MSVTGLIKSAARRTLQACGLTVSRAGAQNRFDATASVLRRLAGNGYAPRVVIDVGANVGQWTDLVAPIFPAAAFHLLEPQTGCHAALSRFAPPRFTVHRVAATAAGVETVQMIGGGADRSSSGAFVSHATGIAEAFSYPATTLDELPGGRFTADDRALLKLDVEGHELEALSGASRLLTRVEVIVSEVRFYDVNHEGAPVFADLVAFLRERGFDLFEFASLSGRARDGRLRLGDVVFVRRDSALVEDAGV